MGEPLVLSAIGFAGVLLLTTHSSQSLQSRPVENVLLFVLGECKYKFEIIKLFKYGSTSLEHM